MRCCRRWRQPIPSVVASKFTLRELACRTLGKSCFFKSAFDYIFVFYCLGRGPNEWISRHCFVGVCVAVFAPHGFVWDTSGCGRQIPPKCCDLGGFGGDRHRWHCQWPVRHSAYVSAIGVLVSLGVCWRNLPCHEKFWVLIWLTSSVIFQPSPQWWTVSKHMYVRPNC